MTVVLRILAAAAAATVAATAGRHLARTGPLGRRNYRGLDVPAAGGVAVLLGLVAGLGALEVLDGLAATGLDGLAGPAAPFAAAALAFAFLGLWDDIASGTERGWRAHVRAVRHGRATSGAIKLVGGGALAVLVVAPRDAGIGWLLGDAALVALSANLVNLLDIRPGRAGKGFLIFAAVLLGFGGVTQAPLLVAAGAVAGFMPFDLRERVMLGDAGANALGAMLGLAVHARAGPGARLAVLAVLVALHAIADAPGLSRGIAALPPLRRLDLAGRVPE